MLTELVVAGDRAEVGENDLVKRIAGVPGKLVLDRADGHHDAAGGDVEGVRTDRSIIKPAQAGEVAREVSLVDRCRVGRDPEMAAQREELLAGAVRAAEGRDIHSTLGVELAPGEASEALFGGDLHVLPLGGHERAVAVVPSQTRLDRDQRRVAAGGQVVGGSRRSIAEEVDLFGADRHVGVDAGSELAAQRKRAAAATFIPVGINTLIEIARGTGPDRQVEQVRLAQADRHHVDQVSRREIDLKRLAAAAKRLAVGDVAEGARNVEDVEVLLKNLDVARQPLKAVGPDADHESAGWGFIDRGDDVGERAVRKRIVMVGPDVGHVHAGNAGKRAGGLAGADGGRRGIGGNGSRAGHRRQGRRRGYLDRRHRVDRRAEWVGCRTASDPGTLGSAVVPGAAPGGGDSGAGRRSAPEPGSCSRACDTSPSRGIIKSP